MRELFRAVVKDGDVTDVDRLVLQNVATLLSQVDGNTWVSFSDTQGSARELTPQQLRRLRPFLERVARDLREHEVQLCSLDADNQEVLDCLQLASVPWADGITAHELLGCCGPEDELLCRGWMDRATAALPSRYMFRSRVRELLNHYYLRRAAPASHPRLGWAGAPALAITAPRLRHGLATAAQTAAMVGRAAAAPARAVAGVLAHAWTAAASAVANTVIALAASAVDAAASCVRAAVPSRLLRSREPIWPALRFFLAAFLHGQLRRIFRVLVLITSWRVVLCLAACSELLGWLLHPAVWLAEIVLHWKKSSRVWGCACFDDGGDPSVLSWVPVKFSDLLIQSLRLVRYAPLPSSCLGAILRALDVLRPTVSFLCDFTFSVGIARGLAALVDIADESAQQKLVWMSMNIARIIRDAPLQGGGDAGGPSRDAGPPELQQGGEAAGEASDMPGQHTSGSEPRLPVWNEDATWNLFDVE